MATSPETPPEPVSSANPLRTGGATAAAEASDVASVPADPFTGFFQRPDGPEILNEQFLGEEVDPAWAPAAERKIRDFVGRHPYGPSYEFEYLECRSTLCRARVAIDKDVLGAIQQVMGDGSPVAGLMHDSLGQELEPAIQAYGPLEGDPDRQQILLILERK
ncbi:MAG TPA: hypothetical protein VFG91_01490 [Woeseiaceae bacterium]|nr:hypothetical protein [Woeseiaceae bacterium]